MFSLKGAFTKLFSNQTAGVVPRRGRTHYRKYTAANQDRLSFSLANFSQVPDADIRKGLKIIRARSRDLVRNNDYVKKFTKLLKNNVVGSAGIQLQARPLRNDGSTIDKIDAQTTEDAWKEWGKKGSPDVTGTKSWWDVSRECICTVANDGELLLRKHHGTQFNKFGFAIELLDAELLDTQDNRTLSNGNQVVMGVELNSFRKPVAYWLTTHTNKLQDTYLNNNARRERVPADQIIHAFIPDFVWQTRGVPWYVTAMFRLGMLGGYEEAAVVAARLAASSMGFMETSEDAEDAQYEGDGEQDDNGDYLEDAEPGSFRQLPPGVTLAEWDPNQPNTNYKDFVKSVLRGVASGLGVSYVSLASDLEGVNFSSIRQGVLDEREMWKELQKWLIESVITPIFEEWLSVSLLNQAITNPGGSPVKPQFLKKLSRVTWQARRWPWVDPLKDSQANQNDINERLRSRSDVIRESGRDPEEVWKEIAEENKTLLELGIPPVAAVKTEPAKEVDENETV